MTDHKAASPIIKGISWGHMDIENIGTGKDFKLWPGGGREWDWTETGTHHEPGIQPDDVRELIEHGAEVVVLSKGQLGRLKTCQETLDFLAASGAEIHMEETTAAVAIYNSLARSRPVGGLFHSTC